MEYQFNAEQLATLLAIANHNATEADSDLRRACQDYLNGAPAETLSNEQMVKYAVEWAITWQTRIDLIKRAQRDDHKAMMEIGCLPYGWAYKTLIDSGLLTWRR